MNSVIPSGTAWKKLVVPVREPVIRVGRQGPSAATRPLTLKLPAFRKSTALWNDTIFLATVTVLSLALNVAALGFSGHDWSLLMDPGNAPQRSLPGLVEAIQGPQTHLQPVQLWYFESLFRLFGPQPLGYHLVNGGVLLVSVLLAHRVLRELGCRRILCVTVPAGFALLLTASDRFSAFGYAPAIALCLLSFYAELRALRQGRRRFWVWKPVALLALLIAGLASAAVIPLLLLAQLMIWCQLHRLTGRKVTSRASQARFFIAIAGAVGSLVLVAVCAWIAAGVAIGQRRWEHSIDLARLVGTDLRYQSLSLQSQVAETLRHSMDFVPMVWAAAIIGLLIASYLWYISSPARSTMPSRQAWLKLTFVGLLVFCAGGAVSFTTMGQGSDSGVDSGVGAALAALGFTGLVCTILPSDLLRREVFTVLVAVVCTSGLLVTGTATSVGEATYARHHAVAQHLTERLPNPPPHSTVLVEQACPGPAFQSSQELAGVLAVTYHDPSLDGALLMSDVSVGQDGLTILLPRNVPKFYAYGERLFVYNDAERDVYRLQDAAHAHRYFITYAARTSGCRRLIHG